MDIRNFFGKQKKKASPSSADNNGRGGGANNNNNNGKKKKAAVRAAAENNNNASDSDTEMEEDNSNSNVVIPKVSRTKNNGKKKAVATNANKNDSDATTTDDDDNEPPRPAKKKAAASLAAAAAASSSSEEEKESPPSKPMPPRRTSPRRTSPRKLLKRKDPPPPANANANAASSSAAGGSRSRGVDGGKAVGKKSKRKIVMESDSSNDDDDFEIKPSSSTGKKSSVMMMDDSDDEDELMKDDDDSDDDDDDFQPKAAAGSNDSDSDDSDDDVVIVQQSKKRRQPARVATSPNKRKAAISPTKNKSATKTKKATNPSVKKEATKAASASVAPVKKTEPTSRLPPKYHPPSTKLTTHIPYLVNNPKLPTTSPSSSLLPTSLPLPKLPNNNTNPNFDLDQLTPHCLEGLTFVFTGILSTNEQATIQTNANVSLSSPTKGDYYTNRQYDCATPNANYNDGGNCELSRDSAFDIIKSLGGRVTTGVSGKSDYLICGCILEDGRQVEEGSKYRKCLEIWESWGEKYRKEYSVVGDSDDDDHDDDDDDENDTKKMKGKKGKQPKKKTKAKAKPKKDADPNTLVEIIRGIYEFYGLVVFLSEWKKGTLGESERAELEARQRPAEVVSSGAAVKMEGTTAVKEEPAIKAEAPPSSSSSANNPYAVASSSSASKPASVVVNPYASKSSVSNPYAKKVSNPYAKSSSVSNPYAKSSVSNPYAKKSPPANPYASASSASKAATTATSSSSTNASTNNHPQSGKQLSANSLWADRYAPSISNEILGNSDSVNKLKKWLNNWEHTFNNPKKNSKGFSGPNGPWKAALLSGPPGIGKTTTATLVARESGRDVLELNASDARSKKALSQALGDVTGSQVLCFDNMEKKNGYGKKKAAVPQKRCIIMDEVDGMGAGDRSGMSELIQMIKKSKVPIICICNDRSSQKMKSLVQYCMDLRYRRPTKMVIARRAVEIGRREGMEVEVNAAEAMAESCGNDIRQVLNCLQMWSCKKKATGSGSASMSYRDLKERQGEINKDEVLRVSMFDACRSIVEGSRGLAGADPKAATKSLMKRTDAFFVDYMLMGLMVHQNYLKVSMGQYTGAKLRGDDNDELNALNQMHEATHAMSDFGMCEESLRGGDQNWSLLPLCSVLAVKVGHHAGGPGGGSLPGYPEFAGWLGKNSTRNKKIRLLQELRRHMNYKVSADAPELRMNYLPIMRQQFQELLFDKEGARVSEAIELMDEYGLDRDDVFENFDEFLFNSKELKVKKFGDLDSKTKSAFTRAYNSMAHKAQALVAEQGAEKTGRKKGGGGGGGGMGDAAELDVVDDDKAAVEESEDEDDDEDVEALKKKFLKKGRKAAAGKGKAAPKKAAGKKGRKK